MSKNTELEVWLRGPLPGYPPLLQPIAQALLQAREEVAARMQNFPEELLWEKPAGVASVGFHLQHLAGVLDRLLTYARAAQLTPQQLEALSAEGKPGEREYTVQELVQQFSQQVDQALEQIRSTEENSLKEPRGVGRAQLPSTVMGLLTHAAEHTMRHVGQLHVTARILMAGDQV